MAKKIVDNSGASRKRGLIREETDAGTGGQAQQGMALMRTKTPLTQTQRGMALMRTEKPIPNAKKPEEIKKPATSRNLGRYRKK